MSDADNLPIEPMILIDDNMTIQKDDKETTESEVVIFDTKKDKEKLDTIIEAEILLEHSCSPTDVTKVIIDQINGLVLDIKEMDELKKSLMNFFPKEKESYRSTYLIDNKVKVFTGFHQTILSYKKELNSMLLKLRSILKDGGGSVEIFKQALKEYFNERQGMINNNVKNKERMKEILQKSPSLMPKEL